MTIIIIILVIIAIIAWLFVRYEGIKCPKCGNRMKLTSYTDTTNIWTCHKCGHEIIIKDYED